MLKAIKYFLLVCVLFITSCFTKTKIDSNEEASSYNRFEEKKSKCGKVDVIMQDHSPRQLSEIVDVYSDEADVPYEIKVIASLTTEGGGGSKESELVERIRCKAAELGADGVIWVSERYDKGNLPVAGMFIKLNRLVIRAKAIAYIARK